MTKPEIDEVRMFAGERTMVRTGFNVGYMKTPIEWRRWDGKRWVPVENPDPPTR